MNIFTQKYQDHLLDQKLLDVIWLHVIRLLFFHLISAHNRPIIRMPPFKIQNLHTNTALIYNSFRYFMPLFYDIYKIFPTFFTFWVHVFQTLNYRWYTYIYRLPSISKHCPSIGEISSRLSSTTVCCYCCGKRMLHANFNDHESVNIWSPSHSIALDWMRSPPTICS